MSCENIQDRLLRGDCDSEELQSHFNQCPSCAKMAGLTELLDGVGAEMREADMSLNTIRETRRMVAHILSDKVEQKQHVGWLHLFGLKVALSAGVVGLCFAIAVVYMSGNIKVKTGAGPGNSSQLVSSDDVERLEFDVAYAFEEFEKNYTLKKKPDALGSEAQDLIDRIDLASIEMRRDLQW